MTMHTRIRGVIAAHANGNPAALLEEVRAAVEGLKNNHRAEIDRLGAEVDNLNGRLAAGQIGGGGGEAFSSAETKRAKAALVDFMRTGRPDALQALTPQNAMSTDSDPDGGYTVPKEIDNVIQSQLLEINPMRRLATIARSGTSEYHKLINRRGATSGWVGERETRSETDTPALADIVPPGGELYAMPEITKWMADDSAFNLDDFLQENVSDEFALQEGSAFVSGDGVKKPRGFLTYDTAETGDATRDFGTLQFVKTGVAAALSDATHNGVDALVDLVHAVKPSYRAGPGVGWQMNSATAGVLRKLKSLGDTANYLWQESTIEGQPSRLLGYPVFENEDMSDIGANAFPIAFGNWRRGYLIVDRSETMLLRDPYTKKGWIRFYFTKRVHGAVTDSRAIKLLKVAA